MPKRIKEYFEQWTQEFKHYQLCVTVLTRRHCAVATPIYTMDWAVELIKQCEYWDYLLELESNVNKLDLNYNGEEQEQMEEWWSMNSATILATYEPNEESDKENGAAELEPESKEIESVPTSQHEEKGATDSNSGDGIASSPAKPSTGAGSMDIDRTESMNEDGTGSINEGGAGSIDHNETCSDVDEARSINADAELPSDGKSNPSVDENNASKDSQDASLDDKKAQLNNSGLSHDNESLDIQDGSQINKENHVSGSTEDKDASNSTSDDSSLEEGEVIEKNQPGAVVANRLIKVGKNSVQLSSFTVSNIVEAEHKQNDDTAALSTTGATSSVPTMSPAPAMSVTPQLSSVIAMTVEEDELTKNDSKYFRQVKIGDKLDFTNDRVHIAKPAVSASHHPYSTLIPKYNHNWSWNKDSERYEHPNCRYDTIVDENGHVTEARVGQTVYFRSSLCSTRRKVKILEIQPTTDDSKGGMWKVIELKSNGTPIKGAKAVWAHSFNFSKQSEARMFVYRLCTYLSLSCVLNNCELCCLCCIAFWFNHDNETYAPKVGMQVNLIDSGFTKHDLNPPHESPFNESWTLIQWVKNDIEMWQGMMITKSSYSTTGDVIEPLDVACWAPICSLKYVSHKSGYGHVDYELLKPLTMLERWEWSPPKHAHQESNLQVTVSRPIKGVAGQKKNKTKSNKSSSQ